MLAVAIMIATEILDMKKAAGRQRGALPADGRIASPSAYDELQGLYFRSSSSRLG